MPVASLIRLFVLAAIWGGSFLLMRIAAPELGAVPTTFMRVLLGAAGLLALTAWLRIPRVFRGRFAASLMLGAINSGAPFLLFAYAARVLPAGYSAIFNATTPLMGVLIGAVVFGEQVTPSRLAGVMVGLGGVVVLTRAGPLQISAPMLLGVAACLGATACYALAGFLTRRWIAQRGGLDSRLVALGSQLGAVALLLPFMLCEWPGGVAGLVEAGKAVWCSVLVLGLVCTSLAYVLYFRLIADIGPLKALTVTFLIPLFGVFWGWLVLGEQAGPAHLAGGGLIAAALWLVLRQPTVRRS